MIFGGINAMLSGLDNGYIKQIERRLKRVFNSFVAFTAGSNPN